MGAEYFIGFVMFRLNYDMLVFFQVHRLVIVDAEDQVSGVVSLSDILYHLVLKPMGTGITAVFQL